jgi:hypothetical protein
MRDEWDIAPLIPRPCYPVRWDDDLPGDELRCKQIDEDHKRHNKEVHRQWDHDRVDWLKDWLDKLRHYQSDPTAERPTRSNRRLGEDGQVYLAWCYSPVDAYKIGHCHDWERRKHSLKKKHGCNIKDRGVYGSLVLRELLEAALHNHFNHCRRGRTEFFNLSQEEVDDFPTTLSEVEWHLMPVEIFRLESRLRQLVAELLKAEQR